MSLHPPSFFLAPRPNDKAKTDKDVRNVDSDSDPGTKDELAALMKENLALKQQLSTLSHNLPAPSPCVLASPQSTVLANDLLQVEAHLQSRMRLLETERKELVLQVEKGRLLLTESEERHAKEMTEIRQTHHLAITKVQLDRERVLEEYNSFRQDKEERVTALEEHVTCLKLQHGSKVKEFDTKIAELEESNSVLASKLDQESQTHLEVSTQLQDQLARTETEKQTIIKEMEDRLTQVRNELATQSQHVLELESYLGGEIPGDCSDGRVGLTWKEERESLYNTVKEQEHGLERLQSENKLLNIRLSSLSEILSIQEADIAKQSDVCVSGEGEKVSLVKTLLTRWREKVFVLLLQQRLQQMEDTRKNNDQMKERAVLLDQIDSLEREKEILSHALTDKTAELQLQSSKSQDLDKDICEAHSVIHCLESQLSVKQDNIHRLKTAVEGMSEVFNSYRAGFGQALTRLVNLDQRLSFASGRLGSLAASVNCRLAMLKARARPLPPTSESGNQTDSMEHTTGCQDDLSSFSRDRLEQEVTSLGLERDSLVTQLRESTESFQRQIQELNETCLSRLAVMEGCLGEVRHEKSSLEDQLSLIQSQHSEVTEERDTVLETVDELQRELRAAQTTLESRVETAVQEQRQKSIRDLAEMEALVNVARREHAKAVVQLQQLQRQLARDRDCAMEAVEMSKAKLEHELETCRKKLQAIQVERNLLMTTLRQEGIVVPVKRQCIQRQINTTNVEGNGQIESDKSISDSTCSEQSTLIDEELMPTRTNQTEISQVPSGTQNIEPTDIREVLKDLQMLSASLLGMETQVSVSTAQQST